MIKTHPARFSVDLGDSDVDILSDLDPVVGAQDGRVRQLPQEDEPGDPVLKPHIHSVAFA